MTFDPNSIQESASLQVYLKILEYGVPGSGKTYNALRMFAEQGKGKVLLLDNESGARHLSRKDGFNFDYKEVKSAQEVIEALEWLQLGDHDYNSVVIESFTLLYKDAQDAVQQKGATKNGVSLDDYALKVNDWGAIKKPLSRLSRMLQRLPMNVIITAREKVNQTWNGKEYIVHGVQPDCEKSVPYDMDIVMRLLGKDKDGKFMASVIDDHCKDRTGMLPSGVFEVTDNLFTDEQVGRKAGTIEMATDAQIADLNDLFSQVEKERIDGLKQHYGVEVVAELTEEQAAQAIDTLNKDKPEEREAA